MTVPAWDRRIDIQPDPCTPSQTRENWAAVIRMLNKIAGRTGGLDEGDTEDAQDLGDNHNPAPYGPSQLIPLTYPDAAGRNPGVIYRNDSSDYIMPGFVLRVTGKIEYEGVQLGSGLGSATINVSVPVYPINQPNASYQRQYMVNASGITAPGHHGIGHWGFESARTAYDPTSGTPAYGESWGAQNGSWFLAKHRPGFYVYSDGGVVQYATDGVGIIPVYGVAWMQQKRPSDVIVKTSGSVSVDGTDTVTIWSGPLATGFAGLVTTGMTIADAFNWGPEVTGVSFATLSWPHEFPIFVRRCT